jgi:hypothetical protein
VNVGQKSKSSTNVTELVMSGLVSGKKGAKPKVVKPRKGGRNSLNTPTVKSSIRLIFPDADCVTRCGWIPVSSGECRTNIPSKPGACTRAFGVVKCH